MRRSPAFSAHEVSFFFSEPLGPPLRSSSRRSDVPVHLPHRRPFHPHPRASTSHPEDLVATRPTPGQPRPVRRPSTLPAPRTLALPPCSRTDVDLSGVSRPPLPLPSPPPHRTRPSSRAAWEVNRAPRGPRGTAAQGGERAGSLTRRRTWTHSHTCSQTLRLQRYNLGDPSSTKARLRPPGATCAAGPTLRRLDSCESPTHTESLRDPRRAGRPEGSLERPPGLPAESDVQEVVRKRRSRGGTKGGWCAKGPSACGPRVGEKTRAPGRGAGERRRRFK